jgi:hypothetical protein
MRDRFANWMLATAAALAALALAVTPGAAQQDAGKKAEPKIIRPKAGPPAPRLPDGHVDLGNGSGSWNAYVIKDFTGHGWGDQGVAKQNERGPQLVEKVVEPQMLPWAQKFVLQVDATQSKDDPEALCLPPGLPREDATPFPFQIYQLPDRLMFLYEGGAHMWRIVYTDGRKHSQDATDYPSYLGESIGHWEGDTMVVDSIGFKASSWLDAAGHPHTEKLHVVQKYSRTSLNNLHEEATIEDPETYVKPWTTSWNIPWMPGITPLEYICQEENMDVKHLVGKTQ